jgi:hypothetical protein
MDTCVVSIFQYIPNKMQRYTVYLYLETALYVSGGNSTHHQERIQLFNALKTKRRPLYLKTQSVPRCKHFSSRL